MYATPGPAGVPRIRYDVVVTAASARSLVDLLRCERDLHRRDRRDFIRGHAAAEEARRGQRGHDADDRHDNQQFDERETRLSRSEPVCLGAAVAGTKTVRRSLHKDHPRDVSAYSSRAFRGYGTFL